MVTEVNVLEKNEKGLQVFGADFYRKYQEAKQMARSECVVEELENGEKIIFCLRNGHEWRLNSIYEPQKAAEEYAGRYGKIKDYAFLCIFGLSDGRAIRELLKNCNETQTIIVYEPDVEIFLLAMEHFPLEDIFAWEKLFLIVEGINQNDFQKVLQDRVTYQNRLLMQHYILPNYDILYSKACESSIERMLYYSKIETFKKNTEIKYAARLADNILYNLPYMIEQSSVHNLEKAFWALDLSKIPAIIVSAGPSLDKNIRELKKAEGKAFIIGVDSSLKALVREQINFQIAVSVDPRKNPDVFADERVRKMPYVLASYSIPLIAKTAENRMFFEGGYGFEGFKKIIESKTGKDHGTLETGGSVATEALSLALHLGFHNIILVGQDLAFTDGRGHVSGFEASEETNRKHVQERELVEVEANGGGMIATDLQMDSYRQWFEMKIEKNKGEVKVYNATEGGAKIRGAEEITLEDAIERLCSQEIDFDRIIAEVPEIFNEEEKGVVCQEFAASKERLKELEQHIKNAIDSYEKLIALENAGKQNSSEYKELLQVVYEVNGMEQKEQYLALAKLYAKSSEYEAAGDIYETEEMSVEEILQKGKALLEGYIEGIHVCSTHIEDILIPGLNKVQ